MAKPAPLLSGEWINAREENVLDATMSILNHLIDQLSSSGHWPLEAPTDDNMLKRMTPEQLKEYIDSLPTIEEKDAVLDYLDESGISHDLAPRVRI